MERKKLILLLAWIPILLLPVPPLKGQELIYEQSVDSAPAQRMVGPNRLHYYHAVIGAATMVPQGKIEESDYGFPLSASLWLGYRYKLKIARPLAIVGEAGYRHDVARIKQTGDKTFPDSIVHSRQSIRTNDLCGGLFIRIRFGQKGDYLGNYLDTGIQGAWLFKNRVVQVDRYGKDPGDWYARSRTSFSNPDFMDPFTWQLAVRLGFDTFALTAAWRPPAIIDASRGPDLPKLTIGLEFSPVRY
jgi:hypothetical protein